MSETALEIDEALMALLREESVRRGVTLSAVVEPALSRLLHSEALPELPTFDSGGALVDISNNEDLCRAMENR